MLRWLLRSTFALFPLLHFRGGLVSWESPVICFMIGGSFWDLFTPLPCRFWSIAQQCGAQLPTHTINYWTELSGVLVSSWWCFRVQPYHRRSVAELCMLFKIWSRAVHCLCCMCRRVLLLVLWLLIGIRSNLLIVGLLSNVKRLCPLGVSLERS